jgi:hypothetical protein
MRLAVFCVGAVLALSTLAGPARSQTVTYGFPGNHVACSKECCGKEQCFGTDCQVCVRACTNPHPAAEARTRYLQLKQLCTSQALRGVRTQR